MPISASELALAYPADYGPLPPTLQLMVGQKLIFGVHLPRQRLNNPYDDFRISKIWGLNMPRAQILAQLPPPPVPYRTPRFSHLHVPVRMMHPRRPHQFAFLRGELPDKLYLSALLRQQPAMMSFQNHHSVLIIPYKFHSLCQYTINRSALCRYAAVAKCADATATTNILFSGPAASLLFRMQPAEYVLLTVAQEDALLASLQGHLFIVEV
ncbi:hypothetical protein LINGRAHAP2_LOCUS21070 [Linum grandiflorum]